jgi:predicted RNA binding protein YcfA (HicA-like mRNA interferase family)
VTGAEAIRKLRRDGWILDRIQGSHHMLIHPVKTGTISVPVHPGRDLAPGTLRKIIRDANLTPAAFFRL